MEKRAREATSGDGTPSGSSIEAADATDAFLASVRAVPSASAHVAPLLPPPHLVGEAAGNPPQ